MKRLLLRALGILLLTVSVNGQKSDLQELQQRQGLSSSRVKVRPSERPNDEAILLKMFPELGWDRQKFASTKDWQPSRDIKDLSWVVSKDCSLFGLNGQKNYGFTSNWLTYAAFSVTNLADYRKLYQTIAGYNFEVSEPFEIVTNRSTEPALKHLNGVQSTIAYKPSGTINKYSLEMEYFGPAEKTQSPTYSMTLSVRCPEYDAELRREAAEVIRRIKP